MQNTIKDLDLLGLRVRDRVTGFVGVVNTVGYDLFGCIQAVVVPAANGDKIEESRWFDTKRLEVIDALPVMVVPDFSVKASKEVPGGTAKSIPRGL
jgi:hypothetical protein